ncbi:hypothetical protein [Alloyangia pacifica]|uniref:hypothetical protein n=1 Tax=Alloyangia pacifica TaxID=311180 RepID=UPI001CFD547A|nr:hypothetical protein [Alloyangia pacifica]
MARIAPLFVNDRNAAALLDMKPTDFRGLVDNGVLPKPVSIGGFDRWDVEQLQTIARGDAADGMGHIEW